MATIAIIALALSACGADLQRVSEIDLNRGWEFVSGRNEGGNIEPIATHPVTITFEDDRVGGTAACNGYGGTFNLDGAAISVTNLTQTEMACEPRETMDLESAYLAALADATIFGISEGQLVLSGPDVELRFDALAPPPTADLLGTVWVLESLVQGDVVSSVSGDRANLELFSDGSFIAGTGCRTLIGNYIETANGIQTTEMSAHGECSETLSSQDSRVVTVLEGEYRVVIVQETLTLTIAGDEGLIYRADS